MAYLNGKAPRGSYAHISGTKEIAYLNTPTKLLEDVIHPIAKKLDEDIDEMQEEINELREEIEKLSAKVDKPKSRGRTPRSHSAARKQRKQRKTRKSRK